MLKSIALGLIGSIIYALYMTETLNTRTIEKTIDDFPWLADPKVNNCRKCPRIYVPVCASDGRTYLNLCKMICMNHMRKEDRKVKMKRYGPCVFGL